MILGVSAYTRGKPRSWIYFCLAFLGATLLAGCATHEQPSLPLADPGLRAAERGNFDHVFLPPGERLPQFNRVYIEQPEVSMSDYWLRDRRGDYNARDLERIQSTYSDLLVTSLTRGLEQRTQAQVVDTPEEADIIFRPQLRSLNIYAPDLSGGGITRQYTREAGNATFDLVLLDHDGNVLGQFIDHRETPSFAGRAMERTNRTTNARQFRRLMDRWTHNLTSYLLIAGAVTDPNGND